MKKTSRHTFKDFLPPKSDLQILVLLQPKDEYIAFIGKNKHKLGINKSQIAIECQKLNLVADELGQKVFGEQINLQELATYLLKLPDGLASKGSILLNKVLGPVGKQIVQNALVNIPRYPPVIEIFSKEFLIPWEWMFDDADQINAGNGTLEDVTRRFWGFNKVIGRQHLLVSDARQTHDNIHPSRVYRSIPKVGLIIDEELLHASYERRFFRLLHKFGIVELVEFTEWQNFSNESQIVSCFNRFILNDDYDILHFACHVEPGENDLASSFIKYGTNLKYYISDYLDWSPQILQLKNPIIFLNACTANKRQPIQTFTLVEELWSRGVSNVIAIESVISSQIAFDFALSFYKFLLRGEEIGECVYKSREKLIKRNRSAKDIMSLFYALYSDPHVKLG